MAGILILIAVVLGVGGLALDPVNALAYVLTSALIGAIGTGASGVFSVAERGAQGEW